MAALNVRADSDMLIEIANSNNSDPFDSIFNALPLLAKPHAAIPQKMNAAMAAFRGLPHRPGQIKGIRTRNPNRLRYGCRPSRGLSTAGPKAIKPMAAARMKIAAASSRLNVENGRTGVTAQSTTTGAIIKSPVASASHQVTQEVVQTVSERLPSLASINPPMATVVPMIAVGAKEISANFAMPKGVSNVLRPFDQRLISHAPANAASSVPIPIKPSAKKERAAIALEANDPSKMAGQIR